MDNNPFNPNRWLPQAIALSIAVVVYVVLTHLDVLHSAIQTFLGFFSPVLLAAVIAYLVNPLANFYRNTIFKGVGTTRARRIASNTLAFVTLFSFLFALIIVLVPQLIDGISAFVDNLSAYVASTSDKLPSFRLFGVEVTLEGLIGSPEKLVANTTALLRQNTNLILETSTVAGKSIIQWAIALLLSIYFLSEKVRLKHEGMNLLAALLPPVQYERTITFLRHCDSILNRYVVFNLLDSLIIGCLNAIFMTVVGIPYVGLVSFVVAVTNLAPTFGPLIGAAIGGFILLLVDLRFTIIFLIFTAVLQVLDGYVIKPRLFGTSLGVSSLLILIGIVVGGRMFGSVGVLLAIPTVAILDNLYRENLAPRLDARRRAQRSLQK